MHETDFLPLSVFFWFFYLLYIQSPSSSFITELGWRVWENTTVNSGKHGRKRILCSLGMVKTLFCRQKRTSVKNAELKLKCVRLRWPKSCRRVDWKYRTWNWRAWNWKTKYKRCFIKKGPPFLSFFHNSLKWWSIYTKFLPVVAKKINIQIIATKYGSWLNIVC